MKKNLRQRGTRSRTNIHRDRSNFGGIASKKQSDRPNWPPASDRSIRDNSVICVLEKFHDRNQPDVDLTIRKLGCQTTGQIYAQRCNPLQSPLQAEDKGLGVQIRDCTNPGCRGFGEATRWSQNFRSERCGRPYLCLHVEFRINDNINPSLENRKSISLLTRLCLIFKSI